MSALVDDCKQLPWVHKIALENINSKDTKKVKFSDIKSFVINNNYQIDWFDSFKHTIKLWLSSDYKLKYSCTVKKIITVIKNNVLNNINLSNKQIEIFEKRKKQLESCKIELQDKINDLSKGRVIEEKYASLMKLERQGNLFDEICRATVYENGGGLWQRITRVRANYLDLNTKKTELKNEILLFEKEFADKGITITNLINLKFDILFTEARKESYIKEAYQSDLNQIVDAEFVARNKFKKATNDLNITLSKIARFKNQNQKLRELFSPVIVGSIEKQLNSALEIGKNTRDEGVAFLAAQESSLKDQKVNDNWIRELDLSLEKKYFAMLHADVEHLSTMKLNGGKMRDSTRFFRKCFERYQKEFKLEDFFKKMKFYDKHSVSLYEKGSQKEIDDKIASLQIGEEILIPFVVEFGSSESYPKVSAHAMSKIIRKEADGLVLTLVNSGRGLTNHQKIYAAKKWKYLPIFSWKCHIDDLNRVGLKYLDLTSKKDLGEKFYDHILSDKSVEVPFNNNEIENDDYTTPQRGGSCSLRAILKLLRLHLPLKEYKKLKFLVKSDQIEYAYDKMRSGKSMDNQFKLLLKIALIEYYKRVIKMEKLLGPAKFTKFFPKSRQHKFKEIIDFVEKNIVPLKLTK